MGNMKGKLLLMAASLLGFGTACESEDSSLTMYGTPYNRFLVKGTVSDPAGNPIPGIQVQSSQDPTAVETGSDGSFEISGRGLFNEAKIRFTDIDGPENGGEFSMRSSKSSSPRRSARLNPQACGIKEPSPVRVSR